MTKAESEAIARRRAEKAFADQKRGDDILAGEDDRRVAAAAKTARLREQRLAKEAAERKPAAKPKPSNQAVGQVTPAQCGAARLLDRGEPLRGQAACATGPRQLEGDYGLARALVWTQNDLASHLAGASALGPHCQPGIWRVTFYGAARYGQGWDPRYRGG